MKLVLLIFCGLIFKIASSQNCLKYKVVDIDSTKSTYLIKVKHKKYKGLIESPKKNLSSVKGDKKIIVGKSYKLNLSKSSLITDHTIYSSRSVHIDDKKMWTTESDFDLLTTKDLNGLYLVVSNSCGCKG